MTFFKNSNGEQIEAVNEYVTSTFQEIIPAETRLECVIDDASWEEESEYMAKHVKIGLRVTTPGAYQGFYLRDKIKVFDVDDKKRDNAIRKLMTYDKIGNGLLFKADLKKQNIIDDNLLIEKSLAGVPVRAVVDVWKINDKKGNWIRAIEPVAADIKIIEKAKEYDDDDMPF